MTDQQALTQLLGIGLLIVCLDFVFNEPLKMGITALLIGVCVYVFWSWK